MIVEVGKKIRNIRELKNFSQEYLAQKLGLTTRAYSKIETEETQLTISRLNEISLILNITPQEILGFDKNLIFNNNPVNQQGGRYIAYNNTEIEQIKELYERLLTEKDKRIQYLENNSK